MWLIENPKLKYENAMLKKKYASLKWENGKLKKKYASLKQDLKTVSRHIEQVIRDKDDLIGGLTKQCEIQRLRLKQGENHD